VLAEFLAQPRPPGRYRSTVQGGLVPNKISGVGTNFGLLVHVLPGPNRLHSGKPPLRGVAASLGPSSATLGGAAREQYAAMEAGGGAVEAPPKKGQLKDRPAAGCRGRKSVEMTATKRISDVLFPQGFEVASPRRSLQSTRMPSSRIRRSMYPRRKKFHFLVQQ
jgi:hypothetical protein